MKEDIKRKINMSHAKFFSKNIIKQIPKFW